MRFIRLKIRRGGVAAVLVSVTAMAADYNAEHATATARAILAETGGQGGLVVHLGCGDGTLTAALRSDERFIVHGLDGSPSHVENARRVLSERGLYGPVSVARLSGSRLPYADNLVRLIVAEGPDPVSKTEMMRVLCPEGVAYVRTGDGWTKTVKPWPDDIDEWTHWLHGPDGNAVAHDARVAAPRRMQWTAGPLWSRHHNLMPSISAMVSAAGRIFYIVDQAPAAMSGDSPDKWMLVARDAFSGVELWKRPITDWGWRAWSSHWEGRFNQPNQIAKRLVAAGDRVYVTLGFNAPLTALDAATGDICKTYEGTDFTDEILYQNGTLILSINESAQRASLKTKGPDTDDSLKADPPVAKSVAAIDAATGRVLWKSGRFIGNSTKTGALERITHLLLAARGKRVYLLDRRRVVALNLESGALLWEAPRPENERYTSRYDHLMSDMCTLMATDQAVLLCQLEPIQKRIGWRVIKARVRAYSPATGETLWTHPCGNWGHFCVPDVFATGGLAWVHDSTEMAMLGLDPVTGVEKRRLSTELAFSNGHHHRCYRNKATDRFLMTSYRGFEFLDWDGHGIDLNHWVRGTCRLGGMPCNGLLYATPHPCDCYITAKLNGLIALAHADEPVSNVASEAVGSRLVKGLAFADAPRASADPSACWPTYRHDAGRSGHTSATIPGDLVKCWTSGLPGPLSAPVAADGKVFVTSLGSHQVHALDAGTGRTSWSYTAEGRVDTPPTLYRGLALFGCRNGWVYAVRMDNGQLTWRFLAAPTERLVGAFGRLESAWPILGGVLVQNGKVYAVAGRCSFLDGGLAAWCLDPLTGEVLDSQTLGDEQGMTVDTGRDQDADYGLVADVLVGDGRDVYLRQRRLFGDGGREPGWGGRLGATGGMLDDSWFNRTYWILDGNLHGETLVHDDETVYAVRSYSNRGHGGFVKAGEAAYKLAATPRRGTATDRGPLVKGSKPATVWRPPAKEEWMRPLSPRVRAMALAGNTLLCVGTPDVVDPDDPWAAYEGRRGGVLMALSAADGKTLSLQDVEGGPVKDGLAVSDGNVYITTHDGRVHAYSGRRP